VGSQLTEADLRLHRVCFTGHRPEKLNYPEKVVKSLLKEQIEMAIEDGYRTFISGMARGLDLWAAEIVLELKKKNKDKEIHLICALPHPDFEKKWKLTEQIKYNSILKKADLKRIICPEFSMGAYQKRNIWMVDRSNRVIAAYNGEKGGTKNTIDYANKVGVKVINIFE